LNEKLLGGPCSLLLEETVSYTFIELMITSNIHILYGPFIIVGETQSRSDWVLKLLGFTDSDTTVWHWVVFSFGYDTQPI